MTTSTLVHVPDQTGRTVVVTGANSGIGRTAARVLASRGARVLLAVRDTAKGQAAAESMTGDVEVRRLDLADLASIRTFADGVDEPVDLLINNAGLMIPPLGRTTDGFELQFGTNHLGHFALTALLLPRVRQRIVTVSSTAHWMGHIDLDDPNWERRPYKAQAAYGQSKLANLLFTTELQRRLTAAGSSVRATSAHPGIAATDLLRPSGRHPRREALQRGMLGLIAQSEEDGALPTLYAATADIPGDSFVGPRGLLQARGAPTLVRRSRRARDHDMATHLWTLSERLVGLTVPEGSAA